MTPEEAIELAEEIVTLIDEDVPGSAMDKAGDFFEDVREKVVEVQATIEERDHVTTAQANALENWKAGVEKWIH
jgi:hypothetical protein